MVKNDPKGKIVDLMRSASPSHDQELHGVKINGDRVFIVDANGSATVTLAGGNIINNYSPPTPPKNKITPGQIHISQATAKKIKDLIAKIVKKEIDSGRVPANDSGKCYAEIHKKLKTKFHVTSYLLIPNEDGGNVIKWLNKMNVLKRQKLRRTNNDEWRNDLYIGIWAKARELEMTKGEVYRIAEQRYGKKISSLKSLGERDLKGLYDFVMRS